MNDSLGNRKHKRLKHSLPIVIDGKKAVSTNIGLGGALVIVSNNLPEMEPLAITITIAQRKIKISGTCLRCRPINNEDFEAAIFFDESSFKRDDLELLKVYLREDSKNLGFLT